MILLGGPIFVKADDPEEWALAVRKEGYSAAYCPLKPEADDKTVRAYAEAADRHGVVIAETGAWSNPLSSDEKERAAAMAKCTAMLDLAERIGALLRQHYRLTQRGALGRAGHQKSDRRNVRQDRSDHPLDPGCGPAHAHFLHARDHAVDVPRVG